MSISIRVIVSDKIISLKITVARMKIWIIGMKEVTEWLEGNIKNWVKWKP